MGRSIITDVASQQDTAAPTRRRIRFAPRRYGQFQSRLHKPCGKLRSFPEGDTRLIASPLFASSLGQHIGGGDFRLSVLAFEPTWSSDLSGTRIRRERVNLGKHGISFAQAATVLSDPNQLTIYDEDHSDDETRWVTMGRDSAGAILVVVHTFLEIRVNEAVIRVISARTATGREVRQYLNQE